MKQKKPGKKLILNKKTIAALDSRQIKSAYGGFSDESCRCVFCGTQVPWSCPPPTHDRYCIV